ncbi:glutathione S-transferase family protein [Ensifer adhaerens]|uniref:glutathione S-transferase family protein n=1 Tax=Ensifer adhaerens TaxID=106592 RepID=UPI000FDB3021|nr:glutathione S-transferase family protein [Ensifer adhaerens]MDF8357848.1 glutathione S-transferase family protein [Ensifer adhaerens]THA61836.1 glutathione S-transferase family protein [Ensifer adhaerens]
MQDFILYNAPQSTCSQRVRYVLNAKGLAFKEHKLDLFTGDQLKPEYLAINPNGVVPSLVHHGRAVTDSAVIMEYLEDILPGGLRPRDAFRAATMRAMMRFIDEVPTPAIRVPSYNLAFLPHYQAMTAEEFQAVCDAKPLRREFLMKMGRSGFPEPEMEEALGRLERGVQRMAAWLSDNGGPWVMGDQLTLADIAIMPVIVRMDDIGLSSMWAEMPAIQRWLDAIRATGAFAETYYYGSLLTEKYPHLKTAKPELRLAGSGL